MTDLRTAAQQALEACEQRLPLNGQAAIIDELNNLRAALAQQAEPVEPVWIQPDHLQKARVAPHLCRVEPTKRFPDFVALYTAPPQRVPLTDEDATALIELDPRMWREFGTAPSGAAMELIRAVERAHKIGEEK